MFLLWNLPYVLEALEDAILGTRCGIIGYSSSKTSNVVSRCHKFLQVANFPAIRCVFLRACLENTDELPRSLFCGWLSRWGLSSQVCPRFVRTLLVTPQYPGCPLTLALVTYSSQGIRRALPVVRFRRSVLLRLVRVAPGMLPFTLIARARQGVC